jgi:hypothetical protein
MPSEFMQDLVNDAMVKAGMQQAEYEDHSTATAVDFTRSPLQVR